MLLLSGLGSIIIGHVRRPPMGGSASVYVISGRMSPSTTPRAPASAASSLCVTPVWDLTFPMCLVRPSWSLVWMRLFASRRQEISVRVAFVV